jgi:diguanylate cyclase
MMSGSAAGARSARRFTIAGAQLQAHLLQTARAHATGEPSFAVLAIRLSCAGVPKLDYRPDVDEQLVRHALQILGGILRPDDRVTVIGPAELIVVLSNLPSPEHAELGAARLVAEYEEPMLFGTKPAQARPTIGIAIGTPGMLRPEDLVRHARTAARKAISAGSGYVLHKAADEARSGEGLEPALRAAVAANGFHLVFQPQVDLASGEPVATEALARWHGTPDHLVPPDVFIPLAERCGLLPSLTHWVLNNALRQQRQFLDAGLRGSMAINVSPVDLRERDFCELVDQALQTWSIPPGDVTLEITETAPVHDPREVVPLLERLKRVGVQLSIDDFGTGYSSLALLRQLPVDEVKIDQQFVRGLLASKQKMDIVRTTLALAANFGLRTVAEGIEDEATLQVLRDMGCELGQGYGIARPADAETVTRWLRDHGRAGRTEDGAAPAGAPAAQARDDPAGAVEGTRVNNQARWMACGRDGRDT